MKTFILTVTAKKQELLNNFLKILNINMASNFNSTKKNLLKKNNEVIVSVLTSPHVNKIGQEQFKLPEYKTQLRVQIVDTSTFFFFIKQLNCQIHPEINVIITAVEIENCKSLLFINQFFDADNFRVKTTDHLNKKTATQGIKIKRNNTISKALFLLELLDVSGKIKQLK